MEKQVKQVLFSCTLNAIRSVMAEALFNKIAPESLKSVSCGFIAGPPDGFTFAVMEEKGISLDLNRQPKLFADFNVGDIDYAVSLSIEAKYHLDKWSELVPHEHWYIKEPFSIDENREAQLRHYRLIRDEISTYVTKLIKRITDNT